MLHNIHPNYKASPSYPPTFHYLNNTNLPA
jgi:hypothetical protein